MTHLRVTRRWTLRGRAAIAAAVAAFVLVVALPQGILAVAAQTSDGGVRPVGSLPRLPADSLAAFGDRIKPAAHGADRASAFGGTLIGIPQVGHLWQLYATTAPNGTDGPTPVAVRDMTTLKIVHTFTIPVALTRSAVGNQGGDWLHAFDGDRRIFLVGQDHTRGRIRTVVEVDLQTFSQRTFDITLPFGLANSTVPGSTQVIQGYLPGGLEYDPYSESVLLLFGGPQIGVSPTTFIHRIDLRTRNQKTRQLRTCNGEMPTLAGTTGKLDGIVTEEYVYFPCQRQGNIGAVVKVRRSALFGSAPGNADLSGTDPAGPITASDEEFVAGPGFLETAFADAVSGRIFLVTLSSEIWAYDITTSSFVGVVAGGVEGQAQVNTGFGLDELTGRLFLQSERLGLGIAEGRFYPIPQARTFPQYKEKGQERIISDAKNNRIFVLTGTAQKRAPAYTIFDVGLAPAPPSPPDPDRNTIDIEEQPGVTEARYFASGTGYGVRTLLAKGIAAVPPAPAIGITSPTGGILADNINSKCGFTDRELAVGRVSKAEYDTGSAAAQAIGVDVDERTKLDLANPSRCDLTARNGSTGFPGIFSTDPFGGDLRKLENGESPAKEPLNRNNVEHPKPPAWAREPASCSSSAGDVSAKEHDSKNEGNSRAHVECPLPGEKLVATSIGYLTGAVAVGRAETSTEIRREGRSVVSRVVSEAQDVDLAGVIRIGRITSVAESRANGRPQKNPMSKHTITIEGVRIGETVVCANNCNIDEVLRILNAGANGRAEFRSASGRDEGLLGGSPKGASTAVQKSVARQTSDQALTGDRSNELPALEMTVYNDNPKFGRARQVFQFAGVATAATYNIALLPTGAGFDHFDDGHAIEAALEPGGSQVDLLLPGVDSFPPGMPAGSFGASSGAGATVIERVARALARGIRMFFTNPRHALLFLTAWSLFSLPGVLSRRRRLLAMARSE